jgi:hypothetical protein
MAFTEVLQNGGQVPISVLASVRKNRFFYGIASMVHQHATHRMPQMLDEIDGKHRRRTGAGQWFAAPSEMRCAGFVMAKAPA